jgi:hypothetical protein
LEHFQELGLSPNRAERVRHRPANWDAERLAYSIPRDQGGFEVVLEIIGIVLELLLLFGG